VDQLGSKAVSDLGELQRFLDDSYRVSYLDSFVKGSIAYQIQALREQEGLTQTQFGKVIGMPQAVISRLEDTEYGGVNINTLLKIANKLKIGLEVRFCNFETVLATDVSPQALQVEAIEQTVRRLQTAALLQTRSDIPLVNSEEKPTVEGTGAWRTTTPNQGDQEFRVFQGSGTSNLGRSTPMPASLG
jgi:transcriptional regulator with XRE-family HTH domain